MSEYRAITITQGSGGFGGPLTVEPKEGKDVLLYITGGGAEPDILPKIVELTGCRPVNGFKTSVPEEEIFLVIIDCGGTLRCGIYPQKRIPTININPVGKSGPMAKYITEDIYVSAVTSKQISLAEEGEAVQAAEVSEKKEEKAVKFNADQKVSETLAAQENKSIITKVGLGVGKFVNTFYQAGRDAIQTCITTLLPFMAFVSLLVGIINGSGFGNAFAKLLTPLAGNFWTGCSWCNLFYPRFIRFTWTRCRYRTDCRNINRNRNWKGNNRSTACTSSPFRNQLSGRM